MTFANQELSAQRGVIDGLVTDSALVALPGVTVEIEGTAKTLNTGSNGRFRVTQLPSGTYRLLFRKLGFTSAAIDAEVNAGDTVRVSLTLFRAATMLDSVRTVSSAIGLSEFEERRRQGQGQFMTASEIDRRNVVELVDLLRQFQGITLVGGGTALTRRSGASMSCPFQVYRDGVRIPTPNFLIDGPSPKDLAGIEVYTTIATVPLRYKSFGNGSTCGVILLWTKRG